MRIQLRRKGISNPWNLNGDSNKRSKQRTCSDPGIPGCSPHGSTLRESKNAAVYAYAYPGRTQWATVRESSLAVVEKGRPATRFTTLSCNYHHKVDFTSSPSGYTTTYEEAPWSFLDHLSSRSPFDQAPFHSCSVTLRPHRER
ncbi:hypothetical protein HZH68_000896 [Vespula germanica]|uniref:Uncharacterized protein n=1 Tax=Vespula germanica TaxID=30212 RepID=A0A834NUL7_VESGE|nr:hypothetical protein HZH68_000896 [Vespula germanica]